MADLDNLDINNIHHEVFIEGQNNEPNNYNNNNYGNNNNNSNYNNIETYIRNIIFINQKKRKIKL